MKLNSKIIVLFLVFAVLLSVSGVSASELNETVQTISENAQENVTLQETGDEILTVNVNDGSEDVLQANNDSSVLSVSNNQNESVLTAVVCDDVNTTVNVTSVSGSVVSTKIVVKEPVLKSSYGKLKKVTIKAKYNKYVTKKVGKYKIKVYKWKGYSVGGLRIYLIKNGHYVKRSAFSTRAYFKMYGKWRWSSWSHASSGYSWYHHYPVSNSVKITKVQVKFRYR